MRWALAASLVLVLRCGQLIAGEELRVAADGPAVTVTREQKLVVEYRYDKTPFKPYVRQLLSPGGTNVLRDAPADHLHHHGLMFAVAANGVNYWEETATAGKQIHEAVESTARGLIHRIVWQAAKGETPVLRETRRIEVDDKFAGGATLLTWRTRLQAADERAPVTLTGSEYFGLGMRFCASMDRASTFVQGKGWCACTSDNGGKPVTVAMFDHPANVRRATWFTMSEPFAYLSATLNLHRQPLEIATRAPLELCYGVAVWDAQLGADEIGKAYHAWLTQVQQEKQ